MRIGLTGGTGFLGQTICRSYREENCFVVTTSKKPDDSEKAPGGAVEYVGSDYSVDSYVRAFDGCDAVIHAGARIPQPTDRPGDATAFLASVESAANLFEACRRLGIRNVVNISSGAVYDHRANPGACETDRIVRSNNAYGTAKRCIEELASFYRAEGLSVKSLRMGKMLGLTSNNKAFWFFLNACSRNETIPIFGEGISGYDYVYVKDAAAAAMYFLVKEIPEGIVNISYGECVKNRDFIPMICEVFENAGGCRLTGGRESCDDFYMSNALARELGWKPSYTLHEALNDIKKDWDLYDNSRT